MPLLKKAVRKIITRVDRFLDSEDPLLIVPYRGYCNAERVYLRGRVLENEGLTNRPDQSAWSNLKDSWRRFESDEVPDVRVGIRIGDNYFETISDREGYFEIDKPWQSPPALSVNRWIPAELSLVSKDSEAIPEYTVTGEVYQPAANAEYGLITDMDDTVLRTYVTSRFKWRMLYATFFENFHQRLPMEGMVELFDAFERGGDGQRHNPVFYLSNSPANIYDYLEQFVALNDLPKGPILLRDYGWHLLKKSHLNHKIKSMRHLLNMYPEWPFILLGDTASEDADLYIQIAQEFPKRIAAIYIRFTRSTKNARRVARLIERETDAEVVLIKNSKEIEEHARLKGLLHVA